MNQIEFRSIEDRDVDFLKRLYGTTRATELAAVPWSDQQKQEFIEMQFNAQHTFYQEQFKAANFNIVVRNGIDVGRLYIDQREKEIRIIDIALLPEFQKLGIGKKLLQDVIKQAENLNIPVTIHVEKNNPAMALYKQLGFKLIEDQGVYDLMQWISAD